MRGVLTLRPIKAPTLIFDFLKTDFFQPDKMGPKNFLRINEASKKEGKKNHENWSTRTWDIARLGNTWLAFWPACLRCRTLVDTKVLLHVLWCSVLGRLKAVLLCLRFVDTKALEDWFVLLGGRKKSRFKNKSCVVCVPWRPYCYQSRWYNWSICLLYTSPSPRD